MYQLYKGCHHTNYFGEVIEIIGFYLIILKLFFEGPLSRFTILRCETIETQLHFGIICKIN